MWRYSKRVIVIIGKQILEWIGHFKGKVGSLEEIQWIATSHSKVIIYQHFRFGNSPYGPLPVTTQCPFLMTWSQQLTLFLCFQLEAALFLIFFFQHIDWIWRPQFKTWNKNSNKNNHKLQLQLYFIASCIFNIWLTFCFLYSSETDCVDTMADLHSD